MLTWPQDKWDKIENDKQFTWLAAKIVKNQWSSSTSPFYRKYRTQPKEDSQFIRDTPDEEYEERGTEFFIRDLIQELHISDRNIAEKYWGPGEGRTMVEIASHYKVDKNFVSKVIGRIKRSVKRRVNWSEGKWDEMGVIEELLPLIGRKRISIEKRQYILDVYNHLFRSRANHVYSNDDCRKTLDQVIKKMKL
jgi:hypothetical protein